jgi:hypothetical protein
MSCKNCDCEELKKFEESFDEGIPYSEEVVTNTVVIRTFKPNVNPNWLKWHQDDENREITLIGDTDWKIQLDNEFPQFITKQKIYIPAGKFHRIINGETNLKIKVHKEETK